MIWPSPFLSTTWVGVMSSQRRRTRPLGKLAVKDSPRLTVCTCAPSEIMTDGFLEPKEPPFTLKGPGSTTGPADGLAELGLRAATVLGFTRLAGAFAAADWLAAAVGVAAAGRSEGSSSSSSP